VRYSHSHRAVVRDTAGNEPFQVRAVRALLRRWPFKRGRGVILRASTPILPSEFPLSLGNGVFIPADLNEFGLLWEFVHGLSDAWRASIQLIAEDDIVFDVGANIGLWGLRAARRAGPGGEIHSFEPDPEIARRLKSHAELNGITWLRVAEVAVTAAPGTVKFYPAPPENSGMGRIGPGEGLDNPRKVEAVSLDSYCRERDLRKISLIKVDVEGAEQFVFEGARGLLRADDAPALMFECSEQLASSMGSSCESTKQLLDDAGYTVFRVLGPGEWEKVQVHESHRQDDLLALKGDRLAQATRNLSFRTVD
jgi:FkbM family methyltransferase